MEPTSTNRQVETAQQIDALLGSHRQWVDRLNKTLICGTEAPDDMIAENSHLLCDFGRFLETRAGVIFPDKALHDDIFVFHKSLHDRGRDLILTSQAGKVIEEMSYEHFLADLKRFQNLLEDTYNSIIETINTTDPLTGAQNRSQMRMLLDERIAKSSEGLLSWVLMIDLDHFKSINDQYGHEVGDRVLKRFSTVVREHIRNDDLFFAMAARSFFCA